MSSTTTTTTSTLWTKGPGEIPLYSDWKVSFTTTVSVSGVGTNKDVVQKDSESVSTASLSSEEDTSQCHCDTDSNVDGVSKTDSEKDEVELSSNDGEEEAQEEGAGETFFSVHRNMIGPNSAYFTQSFLGKIKSEIANSSIIALPYDIPSHIFASVVEAFELILDYCYNGCEKNGAESNLTTENAVAMFCLCKYFEMDFEICEKVLDFINSDLTDETIAKYYQIVEEMRSDVDTPLVLDTKPIMNMIALMSCQSPGVLDSEAELFKIADLSLWFSVASLLANDDEEEEEESTSTDSSKIWSENITSFLDGYEEDDLIVRKDTFQVLTAESVLPEISSKVALRLLEHERMYGLDTPVHQDGLSKTTSSISEDETVSSTEESNNDQEILKTPELTSLQQRCIKALSECNWTGEENDLEKMRGKLLSVTTPAVLEALLIYSVSGERAIISKMEQMTEDLDVEKKALKQEMELFEEKQEKARLEAAMEQQKQIKLERELEEVRKQSEKFQLKLKEAQEKAKKDKEELRKANALLEAELEEEKQKSFAVRQRFREVETAQVRVKSDRENFKLTIQETIKQLEAITTYDEPIGGCGIGSLVMLVSSFSDRNECKQIKNMLQKVVKDPQTYERDYLRKSKTCDESLLTITEGELTSN